MTNLGLQKVEWVESRSRNYPRLVRFYRDILGLPVAFEEDDKEFIEFRVGNSETYLAILGTRGGGRNFVPAIEVADLAAAVVMLRRRRVRFTTEVQEFMHIRLAEFEDPEGNRLQLFEWKRPV